jgi:hypothetical protein
VSEDLDALWASAKPVKTEAAPEDLDKLWEQAKPVKAEASAPSSDPLARPGPPKGADGLVSVDPNQLGKDEDHPTLAAVGNSILHPIDTLTDPSKRRELERGVGNATTFGLANYVAGKADPAFAASAAPDAAAAPGYRGAGEAVGMLAPNRLAEGAVAAVPRIVQGVAKVAAPVVGTGLKVLEHPIVKAASTVAAVIGGAATHGVMGAAEALAGSGAAHVGVHTLRPLHALLERAASEGWSNSKLAGEIAKVGGKVIQAGGTAASQ